MHFADEFATGLQSVGTACMTRNVGVVFMLIIRWVSSTTHLSRSYSGTLACMSKTSGQTLPVEAALRIDLRQIGLRPVAHQLLTILHTYSSGTMRCTACKKDDR